MNSWHIKANGFCDPGRGSSGLCCFAAAELPFQQT